MAGIKQNLRFSLFSNVLIRKNVWVDFSLIGTLFDPD